MIRLRKKLGGVLVHKENEFKNMISLEEYVNRQKCLRNREESEPETYSLELSSDSFLESLIKTVNP